jgi:hypothetical protein
MCGYRVIGSVPLLTLLAACSSGSGNSQMVPVPGPPPFTSVPQVQVSQPSTFGACNGVAQPGTLYHNTAVEPFLAVNPTNTAHLIAVFQKDRWSNGGSQAQNLAVSFDGGTTWMPSGAAFSVCTGGSPANAGNYLRASDGWLAISPTGVAYALSLAFTGGALAPGSSNGQLVARSIDGGVTWSTPIALIAEGAASFNDKGSITADPTDANYIYAVWDRLASPTAGPSYLAVSVDAGNSWLPPRSIYDPGPTNQTLGNIIVVLPGDILVDVFTEIDTAQDGTTTALLRAIRSPDRGTTWSPPITIADNEAVGAVDPQTAQPIRDSSDLFSVSVSAGGVIYVVWQDARFSAGKHDGIALTSSADGGLTWSTPVQVNADPNVPAFSPTINVRAADGVIGISYYDLRNDTVPGTVLTDCWMVTSTDGTHFKESHLSGPFDLALAPRAEIGPNNTLGLFLGDYQGLASSGAAFLPFYAQTNPASQISSDVFIGFPPAGAAAAQSVSGAPAAPFRALAAPSGTALTTAARQRVMERIRLTQAQRLQGR